MTSQNRPFPQSAGRSITALSRRFARTVAAVSFTLFAGAAMAADIVVDDAAVEPLPGRDYSMRLDVAASRFEQIDAQTGEVRSRVFSAECAEALAPGLWLAVPATSGLELLPLGTTHDSAMRVAAGCRISPDENATLPPALVQQISASGGGVVYVDASGFDSARVAASGAR